MPGLRNGSREQNGGVSVKIKRLIKLAGAALLLLALAYPSFAREGLGLTAWATPGETFGKTWKISWKGNIERINLTEYCNVYFDSDDVFFQGGTAVSVAVPIKRGDIGAKGMLVKRSGARENFMFYLDVRTGEVELVKLP